MLCTHTNRLSTGSVSAAMQNSRVAPKLLGHDRKHRADSIKQRENVNPVHLRKACSWGTVRLGDSTVILKSFVKTLSPDLVLDQNMSVKHKSLIAGVAVVGMPIPTSKDVMTSPTSTSSLDGHGLEVLTHHRLSNPLLLKQTQTATISLHDIEMH